MGFARRGPEDLAGGVGERKKTNKINRENPGLQEMVNGGYTWRVQSISVAPSLGPPNCTTCTSVSVLNLFGRPQALTLHFYLISLSLLTLYMTKNPGFLVCILLTLFSTSKSFTIFTWSFLFYSHVSSLFKGSTPFPHASNLIPCSLLSCQP